MNLKSRITQVVCLPAVLLLLTGYVSAQRTITGTVTDEESGETLIGVNILVVGTNQGTITDFDGSYSIDLPEDGLTLEFSYTGYAQKRLTVGPSDVLDVTLRAGELLDEVVVIGYGTVKKDDATGSVNAVDGESFNRGAIVSPDQLITGKIAGVQITPNNGEPGGQSSIRIRGGTSINASNEPLYVIDGVPIDNSPHNPGGFSRGRNPLNFLNPSDIETFTVLKDASATAIYGSRGANGVIIITTKKGKAGSAPRISYDGYYVTSDVAEDDFNIFQAEDFRNVVTFAAPEALDRLGNTSTNWFEELTQRGSGHNHSLSLTGGGQDIGYRISAGYQQLEGVVRGSETERTSVGLNYNHKMLEDRLLINVNLKGAFTEDLYDPGQVGSAFAFDPTQPVRDPDNEIFGGFFEYGVTQAPRNPVSAVEQIQDVGKNFRGLGNMEIEYKFDNWVPGLSAKVNLGFDINNGQRQKFQPTTYINSRVSDITGEIRNENIVRTSKLLESYLTYNREFSTSHRINVTAGYSYQGFRGEFPSFRAFDLSTDIFGFSNTNPASEFEADNSIVENRLISFFGRANYAFKDKYLLTFTLRRDGSTRFSENNRWGTFPSAAFAWRILQEDFATGIGDIFSNLKLRVGYGITGNQEIGDFRFLPRYTLSDATARYQFGDQFVTTARPDGYDANLKWEETTSYNIGLDFGFSNGRINGTIEYYFKETDDLLFEVNVPAGTNLTDRVLTNIGSVENQGIELTLDAFVVNTPKFSWNLGLNVARNINEITAIDQVSGNIIQTGGINGGVGSNIQALTVGQPSNAFYVFRHKLDASGNPLPDGIDHNDDGVIDNADIYEDVNGDGTVNSEGDRTIFEKANPDVILGLTSLMNFGGLDFSFTLRSNIGGYVYNNNASERGFYNKLTLNPTSLDNLHTSVLVTNFGEPQYFSDYYIEDGTFLRLDNVTLGYNFDNLLGDGMNLRLYATGQNLFLLTEYSGTDPEVTSDGSGSTFDLGIDKTPYPRARTFIFGLNLGF